MSRHRHHGARGQALLETAVLLPILLLLFVGVYSASELASAENAATAASRNAARLGAEIGNDNFQPGVTSPDPTGVDQRVVAAVSAALAGASLPGVTLSEVDVYSPLTTQPAGYFSLSDPALPVDRYRPDGTPIATYQYGLDQRDQQASQERQLGVRVLFTYSPPALSMGLFGGPHAVYTVFTFPPV